MNNLVEILLKACCARVHPGTDNRRRSTRMADVDVVVSDSQGYSKSVAGCVYSVWREIVGVGRSTYHKSNQFKETSTETRHIRLTWSSIQ